MNIGEAIVKNLELLGVEAAFGGSGSGIADILFALKKSNIIQTIIVRHEQAASFMACGYAMFSGKLGVCFATPGPGAFNLISGLCVALCDSLPVLAITGYEPRYGRGKGGLGETTGLNRTPNSHQVFAATTKKTFIIEHPKQTCEIVEEAINMAFEGRPGPVHIHLPFDISGVQVPNYYDISINVKPVEPSVKKIVQFAEVLEHALKNKKKILSLIGYGCFRSQARVELLTFLEAFQIPFMTTMDAKGLLPENHPLSVGMTGAAGDPGAKQSLIEADVVLSIGNSFSKWQTWRWADGIYDNKILMQINIDEIAINRVYMADYFMVSDARLAIKGITEVLQQRISSVDIAQPIINKHYNQLIKQKGDKIHPGALAREISLNLPKDSIIMGDAGNHMLWLAAYMQLNEGQLYQNPGIFGPMAANVNAAIGVQCANPNRRVIVGCGDGDYQMAGFELMTAVENKIPIVWIIFNNNEFNIIKMMHMRNYNGQEAFNKFLNPDFSSYAKSCGAHGYNVTKLEDFSGIFQDALATNEPAVIDVVVDAEVYPPFGPF